MTIHASAQGATQAIPVIVNTASGPGEESRAQWVRDAFAARQLAADVMELGKDGGLAALVARAMRKAPPLLVAGGGDGTVGAIAAYLVDGDVAFGVLPLGTLNHFAKDLGIPLVLEQAVGVIADGHRVAVDAGELNGRVFLNNSSLGLYPRIVSDREQARHRLHMGKWPALARATWHALRDPHAFTVNIRVDGEVLQRRTPFVFIGNNRYQLQGFAAGSRPRLDEGVLSLYVLRPQTFLGFLRIALRAVLGRVSSSEDFESFTATELQVESSRAQVGVALDGEVAQMDTPLRYRIRPRALQVLAPRGNRADAG